MQLQAAAWPAAVEAGRILYVNLHWDDPAPAGLNMSLRLYDGDGKQVAQEDGPLEPTGAVGVPPEGIGLVLGVDRFLDMCRTTLNVIGDLVAATVISAQSEEQA